MQGTAGADMSRRAQTAIWIRGLAEDGFASFRALARSPGYTATAVLSLSIGIGLSSTAFASIATVLRSPVPGIHQPDRVVELLTLDAAGPGQEWAYADVNALGDTDTPFDHVAAWKARSGMLGSDDVSFEVRLTYVSSPYFTALGVEPFRGRFFGPNEDTGRGDHPVTVVSYAMWKNRLGGGAEVVGSTVEINRTLHTIVGIAPEEFRGHRPLGGGIDFWLPLVQHPWVLDRPELLTDRAFLWPQVLGRLRPGATLAEANEALDHLFASLEDAQPGASDRRALAAPIGLVPAMSRSGSYSAAWLVMALMGVILVIVCANVAGMTLARGVKREREMAVRLSLGAGRVRVARLLLIEAALVAAFGGAVGVLLGERVSAVLLPVILGGGGVVVRPGVVVYLFSVGLTALSALTVGLLPAARFSRAGIIASLRDDTGVGGRRTGRLHRVAASAQTGLAFALLAVCALHLRSVEVLVANDHGFEPERLLVSRLDLEREGYTGEAQILDLLSGIRSSVASISGVETVSFGTGLPLDRSGSYTSVSTTPVGDDRVARVPVEFVSVLEDYFDAAGIPMLRGRGFASSDGPEETRVAVLEESLAARLWPGDDAAGRSLWMAVDRDEAQEFRVVGVVPDIAGSDPSGGPDQVFVPLRQVFWPRVDVVTRVTTDPEGMRHLIRDAIHSWDPGLPPPIVRTGRELVEEVGEANRVTGLVAAGLGVLALLLSAIGVYAVVSFAVLSRTREIGLRMALGASRHGIVLEVLGDAVRLAMPGLLLGGVSAAVVGTSLRSALFGLAPLDAASFVAAAAALLVVVILASCLPAGRASGVDPVRALGCE